jgi:hypothetical protein
MKHVAARRWTCRAKLGVVDMTQELHDAGEQQVAGGRAGSHGPGGREACRAYARRSRCAPRGAPGSPAEPNEAAGGERSHARMLAQAASLKPLWLGRLAAGTASLCYTHFLDIGFLRQ